MTAFLLDNAALAVAIPFVLAGAVGLLGKPLGKYVAWPSMLAPLVVLATGLAARMAASHGADYTGPYLTAPTAEGSVRWLLDADPVVSLGWAIDGLTAIMLVVVGLVALMVMIFSIGYMAGDAGIVRYYALLSLFTGSMTLLVLSDNLVGLFVGWELVGACSYLLIGFWFRKPSAAAAAVKAFLTTRVGDVGLLFGIAILWSQTGDLTYSAVFGAIDGLAASTITVVALLLFVGAVGKSAQFPLHIWLPDAMEGPTPVSALIHAATMVAAGVFLVARVWPLFEASEIALAVVLWTGTFTALAAATVALAQNDIKKVLAYSTISQLGFMFAALGAGAWVAAIFHLATHAMFKALLFLGSGSVIHASETQDMREMGGLRRSMRLTAVTWLVGAAALAGVPPLAGFFSKDEVLNSVVRVDAVAGVALFVASLLTAFYITRATLLTFFGRYRGDRHPHEGGWSMKLPLLVLAIPAAGLGWASHYVAETMGEHGEPLSISTAAASVVVAFIGIAVGWILYRDGARSEARVESLMGRTWTLLSSAYGYDAAVSRFIVRPTERLSRWLYRVLDRGIIDTAVEGVGTVANRIGAGVARIQFGDAQWYASLIGAGVVFLLVFALLGWGS